MYVTGFDRGVLPIGDWSTSSTLESSSCPVIDRQTPGGTPVPAIARFTPAYRTSWTSVLLPLPLTPVTQTSRLRGIATLIPLRLCRDAPSIRISRPEGTRRDPGTGIFDFPLRYAPVSECASFRISPSVPAATTSPPCSPARGPMSTIMSAARIMSASCSTTITVFPASLSALRIRMSLSLSRGWSPMLGSSRT